MSQNPTRSRPALRSAPQGDWSALWANATPDVSFCNEPTPAQSHPHHAPPPHAAAVTAAAPRQSSSTSSPPSFTSSSHPTAAPGALLLPRPGARSSGTSSPLPPAPLTTDASAPDALAPPAASPALRTPPAAWNAAAAAGADASAPSTLAPARPVPPGQAPSPTRCLSPDEAGLEQAWAGAAAAAAQRAVEVAPVPGSVADACQLSMAALPLHDGRRQAAAAGAGAAPLLASLPSMEHVTVRRPAESMQGGAAWRPLAAAVVSPPGSNGQEDRGRRAGVPAPQDVSGVLRLSTFN